MVFLAILTVLIVLFSFIASSRPILTIGLMLCADFVPTIFMMTPDFDEEFFMIGNGVLLVDAFMLSMAVSTVYRIARLRGRLTGDRLTDIPIILLGCWIGLETLRNFSPYGMGAFGEFRTRYLILIIPFYVVAHVTEKEVLIRMIKMLVVICLIPLLCIPTIGALKGWVAGSDRPGLQRHSCVHAQAVGRFTYSLDSFFRTAKETRRCFPRQGCCRVRRRAICGFLQLSISEY